MKIVKIDRYEEYTSIIVSIRQKSFVTKVPIIFWHVYRDKIKRTERDFSSYVRYGIIHIHINSQSD